MDRVSVFAPATVANLGPGFDHLGVAITGFGDLVTAEKKSTPGLELTEITGLGSGIPTEPEKNTAAIAAAEALRLLGYEGGVRLQLHKGLPIGSGLGGSAASAVAGAWAVFLLLGVHDKDLAFRAALAAEAQVSGNHADNVAPCIFGGLVLVDDDPARYQRLPVPRGLRLVVAVPSVQVITREARRMLPEQVSLSASSANSARLAAMVAAAYRGSVYDFAAAIRDEIVEPVRARLIPGFYDVKQAALQAGALACSISGAGPAVFAIVDSDEAGERVARVVRRAFAASRCDAVTKVVNVDRRGARSVTSRSTLRGAVWTASSL